MTRAERDVRRLIEPLGWRIIGVNGHSHWKVRHHTGRRAVIGRHLGDPRTMQNIVTDLRKALRKEHRA